MTADRLDEAILREVREAVQYMEQEDARQGLVPLHPTPDWEHELIRALTHHRSLASYNLSNPDKSALLAVRSYLRTCRAREHYRGYVTELFGAGRHKGKVAMMLRAYDGNLLVVKCEVVDNCNLHVRLQEQIGEMEDEERAAVSVRTEEVAGSGPDILRVCCDGETALCRSDTEQCKHQLFVLHRLLGISAIAAWQSALIDVADVMNFANSSPVCVSLQQEPITKVEITTLVPVPAAGSPTVPMRSCRMDSCCLCLDKFVVDAEVVYCGRVCGRAIHLQCFENWKLGGGNPTDQCPSCRAQYSMCVPSTPLADALDNEDARICVSVDMNTAAEEEEQEQPLVKRRRHKRLVDDEDEDEKISASIQSVFIPVTGDHPMTPIDERSYADHLQPTFVVDYSELHLAAKKRTELLVQAQAWLEKETNVQSVRLCLYEADTDDASPLCLATLVNYRKRLSAHSLSLTESLTAQLVPVRSGDGIAGTPWTAVPRLTADHYTCMLPRFHSFVRTILACRSDVSSVEMGFGYDAVERTWHSEPSLIVRVLHKGYRPMFEPALPKSYEKLPVFVAEGCCRLCTDYKARMDPILPGALIVPCAGEQYGGFGTVGAIIATTTQLPRFLTNAHVAFPQCSYPEHLCVSEAADIQILQPGPEFLTTSVPNAELVAGTDVRCVYGPVPYRVKEIERDFGVDAALCTAIDSRNWQRDPHIPIHDNRSENYKFDPRPIRLDTDMELIVGENTLLAKRGSKTLLTYGQVHFLSAAAIPCATAAIGADFLSHIDSQCKCPQPKKIPFLHQYMISSMPMKPEWHQYFAEKGDSGSMIYLITPEKTVRPFALLHSVELDGSAYASPIEVVMHALNLASLS